MGFIEVTLNDRLGGKTTVKCNRNDSIGDLKKLGAAQLGVRPEKLRFVRANNILKDHISLDDVRTGLSRVGR